MLAKSSKTLQYVIPGWFQSQITTNPYGLEQLVLMPLVPVQQMLLFDPLPDPIPEICPEDEMHWAILQQIQEYLHGKRYDFDVGIGVLIWDFRKKYFRRYKPFLTARSPPISKLPNGSVSRKKYRS